MIKFKLDDRGLARELKDSLKEVLKTATSKTVNKLETKARETAASKLNTSLDIWQKGFKVSALGNGNFALTINGELAKMIEDGINPGDISRLIMQGNRARINKAEGKNYVDVPLKQDESSPAVKVFRSADDLIADLGKKDVKFSDPKNKSLRHESRHIRRFRDNSKEVEQAGGIPGLMESKKTSNSKPMYLLIRRVSRTSTWPERKVDGAETWKEMEDNLEKYFEESLRSLL